MFPLLSPSVFVSYSRRDSQYVASLSEDLRRRGFRVFVDTADIDPGENFVNRLSSELQRASAVFAVISEHYLVSRWGQAELYHAVAMRKMVIPVVIPPASISGLDQPLERLLRDTQFVTIKPPNQDRKDETSLSLLLQRARRRHRWRLIKRSSVLVIPALFLALVVWWAVTNLNALELKRRRERLIMEVTQASEVLQAERVHALAAQIAGDREAVSEILLIADDHARSDVQRFNALVLSGELLQPLRVGRWYIKDLNLDNVSVKGSPILDTSFLSGHWSNVQFDDLTFSGTALGGDKGFAMSNTSFRNVRFHGSLIGPMNAVNVSFINSKFRGTEVDTTDFAKVRFVTERPVEEGAPTITTEYTLFEHSTLISRRTAPEPNVMDLSVPEDDVVFEEVMFVDCRLEGWFKPEWFRNSTFERCELPPSLRKEELERLGNTVY